MGLISGGIVVDERGYRKGRKGGDGVSERFEVLVT